MRLQNGIELDVSSSLRVLETENGFYVVWQGTVDSSRNPKDKALRLALNGLDWLAGAIREFVSLDS